MFFIHFCKECGFHQIICLIADQWTNNKCFSKAGLGLEKLMGAVSTVWNKKICLQFCKSFQKRMISKSSIKACSKEHLKEDCFFYPKSMLNLKNTNFEYELSETAVSSLTVINKLEVFSCTDTLSCITVL